MVPREGGLGARQWPRTDISVEGKADGFTHGFVVTFETEKGREVYLPHPAHQEFVKLVGPRVEKVLVFDFWASKE